MTKIDQALQIVMANPTNKEGCIAEIMKVNNTYRSNALVYYKKALAMMGSSVPASKVAADKIMKSAGL